jgi:hypothetical protein
MKPLFKSLLVMLLSLGHHAMHSQTISDCLGAVNLCESFYFEEQAPLNTGDIGEFTGTCNQFIEWNSVWYTFTVQSDGNLSFVLTPNDLNDDYDWGLFDITVGGCNGITAQDGSSPEVSCNSWGTLTPPNGTTGISTSLGGVSNSSGPGDQFGPPFNSDLPVTEGHTFALVVMNWTGSSSGYSIDFAESTAALFDAIPPTMIDAELDCDNQTLTIAFSENVLINTAQNLDFEIAGPSGVTVNTVQPLNPDALGDQLNLIFTEPISVPGMYQLIVTDVSGLIEDPCGNTAPDTIDFEVQIPVSVAFEITPACNGLNGTFTLTQFINATSPLQTTLSGMDVLFNESMSINAGDYLLSVSDALGCGFTQLVSIPNEILFLDIIDADTLTCFSPTGAFEILTNTTAASVAYSWTTIDGLLSANNVLDPIVSSPGMYTCTATTVPNGCSVSDTYEVISSEVYTIDESQIVFPNIISPNQDNLNDTWAPRLRGNPDYDMTSLFDVYDLHIYDRWGKEVFEGNATRFWSPEREQRGVYFYTLIYRVECGEGAESKVEGTIQIVE